MPTEALMVPLAEHFHSIQGEGFWVGTPMHFIRLAGCPVGAKATQSYIAQGRLKTNQPLLPILVDGTTASKCQTYDGRFFDCDTNFNLSEKMHVEALLEETYEKHICLTGGEPLIHQNSAWWYELCRSFENRGGMIHIETSGTIIPVYVWGAWITIAPKFGFLPEALEAASEVKLLVDEEFKLSMIPAVERHQRVYLSPINDEKTVNQKNVDLCMELLKVHSDWFLSAQWHKFLGVR